MSYYRLAAITATIATLLCCSHAMADYSVFGNGNSSCGAFIEAVERERRNPNHQTQWDDRYYIGFISYANGYLSGANMEGEGKGRSNIGDKSDLQGRTVWLENWCKQNPLSYFAEALVQLVIFLKREQR
jgi:hypothetical protein